MDSIENGLPISYIVATIGTDIDGRWTITYYGDVPEQGGISLKRGQLTFYALKDAITFLSSELPKHDYVQMIKDTEK